MDRIDDVEQILRELGILPSFTVIQEDKEDDQEHGPLIVKAQITIK